MSPAHHGFLFQDLTLWTAFVCLSTLLHSAVCPRRLTHADYLSRSLASWCQLEFGHWQSLAGEE